MKIIATKFVFQMWKKPPIKLVNHNEQHQIGVDTFDDKYHLKGAWIKADEKLNEMLRGGE